MKKVLLGIILIVVIVVLIIIFSNPKTDVQTPDESAPAAKVADTIQKIKLGHIGEEAAVSFLKRQGYHILERNFRNKLGEIDIIAIDDDILCFVEVKTRRSEAFGSPFESVTASKQRKIIHVAMSYLKLKEWEDSKSRFDVVAVFVNGENPERIEIIRNAFNAN